MEKNYLKPEIIEEVSLDRKLVYAGETHDVAGGEPGCQTLS
ncbi:MAG TPA: hypothetical protein PL056_08945 [bacterium]|nr:hypothetical protein [bacterium]